MGRFDPHDDDSGRRDPDPISRRQGAGMYQEFSPLPLEDRIAREKKILSLADPQCANCASRGQFFYKGNMVLCHCAVDAWYWEQNEARA